MHRHSFLFCVFAFALLWTPHCQSTQIYFEPLETILKSTEVAIVADIVSAVDHRENTMWRSIAFQAKVVKTIFGEHFKLPTLQCVYQQGQPHGRGAKSVSPRATGSGVEFDIKSGDRVIFLIEHAPKEAKACVLLRIEPLKNETTVKGPLTQE